MDKIPIELTSTKCELSSNITILLSWSRKVGSRSHEQDQCGSFRLRIRRASIFRLVDLGKSYVPFSTTSSHLLPRNQAWVYLVFLTTSRSFFFFFSLSSFHPSFTGSLEGTSSFTPSVFDGSLFASNIIVWINCEAKKLYIRELSRSRVLFVRKILFVGTKFLFKLLCFSFFKLTIW